MPDTTTDLHIPDEAEAQLRVCDTDAHLHDRAETCVAPIAAPVVAAELRSLADDWTEAVLPEFLADQNDPTAAELRDRIAALRARAADHQENQ